MISLKGPLVKEVILKNDVRGEIKLGPFDIGERSMR